LLLNLQFLIIFLSKSGGFFVNRNSLHVGKGEIAPGLLKLLCGRFSLLVKSEKSLRDGATLLMDCEKLLRGWSPLPIDSKKLAIGRSTLPVGSKKLVRDGTNCSGEGPTCLGDASTGRFKELLVGSMR